MLSTEAVTYPLPWSVGRRLSTYSMQVSRDLKEVISPSFFCRNRESLSTGMMCRGYCATPLKELNSSIHSSIRPYPLTFVIQPSVLITRMAGIYLHIPFCRQACHYCNFHFSTSLKGKNDFVAALLKEMKLRKDYINGEI